MPEPSKGEKQSDFIGRCVRMVMGEGKEQKAALGECYGIWRQHHGGTAKLFSELEKRERRARQREQESDGFNSGDTWQEQDGELPFEREPDPDRYEYYDPEFDSLTPRSGAHGVGTYTNVKARTFADICKDATVQSVHVASSVNDPEKNDPEKNQRRRRRQFTVMEEQQHKPGESQNPEHELKPGDEATSDIVRQKRWKLRFEVKKAEPEKQLIFGWASVAKQGDEYVVDYQGDIIPVSELENAAFEYMKSSRKHGLLHRAITDAQLVVSFLTTPDIMKAFGLTQKDGTIGWIVGYHVADPELWAAHKRGDLPEFSISGSCRAVEPVYEADLPDILREMDKARGRRLARAPFRY
jgi:Putative phage serine protease XkdF